MKTRFISSPRESLLVILLALPAAHAQSVWTGSTDSVVSTGTNYTPAIANTAVSNLNIHFNGSEATTEDLILAVALGGGAGGAGSAISVLTAQSNPLTITGSGSAAIRFSTGLTVEAGAGAVTLAGVGNLVIGGITSATSHSITNLSSNLLDLGSWPVISGGGGARSLTVEAAGDISSNGNWSNSLSPLPSTNPLSLTKTGAGKLTLGGTNTVTGNTLVSAGVLELTNPLALQNSALDTSGTGTVTVAGPTALTIGGLTGSTHLASVITTGYSGITELTLNPRSGTQTYSGNIANGAPGMNLVKSGAGTQLLAGTNTYTGLTTIGAGILRLGSVGALGDGTNNTSGVVVNGTGIFDLAAISPTATAPLTLNSTANGFDVGSFTNSLAGTATFGGTIDMQATTVRAGANTNAMVLTGAITGNGRNFIKDGSNRMTLSNSGSVSLGTLQVFRGILQLDGGTILNPSGNFTLGGGNSVSTSLTLNGGSLTVPSGQTATFGSGAGTAVSSVTLTNGTLTVPKLTKGSQNYSVNFNGGSLKANADSATFLISASSALVQAGGALIDDGGFLITIPQALSHDSVALPASPDGGLTKSGSGTLTLSGVNTYTGNTILSAGAFELAASGSLKFVPTAPGLTNKVTGTGTASFKGAFAIDLASAHVADNNSWILADLPGQSFDPTTFSVTGFTELPEGTWKLVDVSKTWTFTEGDATLRLDIAGYASWLALFPELADITTGGDSDFDGIVNLLEYTLNGNPQVSDNAIILPTLNTSGADFEFTFTRRADSAADTTQVFEYGSTLATWTPLAITGTPGPGVALGPVVGATQSVTITIPKNLEVGGKLFGRLKVTQP